MAIRLTEKTIEDVVSAKLGPDMIKLVHFLKDKEAVSELKIARLIRKEVKDVRNMLYRLFNENLVSFTRKKDKKNGLYIYYWTFNKDRIRAMVGEIRDNKLEKLKARLEKESSNQFYSCESKCMRLDFDHATNLNFKCPECGELMNQEDNSELINELRNEIKKLETKK